MCEAHEIMSVGNELCHAGKNDISPACRQKGRSFLRDRATARQRENARAFASTGSHCFLRKQRKMSHYTEKYTDFGIENYKFSVGKRKSLITPLNTAKLAV